jgi:hypothetical protein
VRLNEYDTTAALKWLKQEEPTEEWAKHYGGSLAAVKALIQLSSDTLAAQFDREQQLEVERERNRLNTVLLEREKEVADQRAKFVAEQLRRKDLVLRFKRRRAGAGLIILGLLSFIGVRYYNDSLTARHRSTQAKKYVALADRDQGKPTRASDLNELRHLSVALRYQPGRGDIQKRICDLLLQKNWCIPRCPTLRSEGNNPLFICATEQRDGSAVLALGQDGSLLLWVPKTASASVDTIPKPSSNTPSPRKTDDLEKEGAFSVLPHNLSIKGVDGQLKPAITGPQPQGTFRTGAFSEDGKRLAVAFPGNNNVAGRAYIWKCENGEVIQCAGPFTLPLKGSSLFYTISWSRTADNDMVVIQATDYQTQKFVPTLIHGKDDTYVEVAKAFENIPVCAICFSPDGKLLLTSAPNTGTITRWETHSDGVKLLGDTAVHLPFSPWIMSCNAAKTDVVASTFGRVCWARIDSPDPDVKTLSMAAPNDRDALMRAIFSPKDNKRLAIATPGRVEITSLDNFVIDPREPAVSVKTPREPLVFQGMGVPSFSQDGDRILVTSGSSLMTSDAIRSWDIRPLPLEPPDVGGASLPGGDAPPWVADLAWAVSDPGYIPEDEFDTRPSVWNILKDSKIGSSQKQALYGRVWNRFEALNR